MECMEASTRPAKRPVIVLKVSTTSRPAMLAGAIAGEIRGRGWVEMEAVGDGAVNQAVKWIAIAQGYLAPQGTEIWTRPGFFDIDENGEHKTGIRFRVEVIQ